MPLSKAEEIEFLRNEIPKLGAQLQAFNLRLEELGSQLSSEEVSQVAIDPTMSKVTNSRLVVF